MESSCRTWNKFPSGFHPGQLSFLLRASSDALPTAVNLRRWHIQCNVKCVLCDFNKPTTVGDCPVALLQQRYTFRHNQVSHILASKLSTLFTDCEGVADLQGLCFNESPQETVPSTVDCNKYIFSVYLHTGLVANLPPFMSCSCNSIVIILQNVCISGSEYLFMHVTYYDHKAVSCTTMKSMFFSATL